MLCCKVAPQILFLGKHHKFALQAGGMWAGVVVRLEVTCRHIEAQRNTQSYDECGRVCTVLKKWVGPGVVVRLEVACRH